MILCSSNLISYIKKFLDDKNEDVDVNALVEEETLLKQKNDIYKRTITQLEKKVKNKKRSLI